MFWLAGVMALTGAVTAFIADADLAGTLISAAFGGAVGFLLGAVPVPKYLVAIREADAQAAGLRATPDIAPASS